MWVYIQENQTSVLLLPFLHLKMERTLNHYYNYLKQRIKNGRSRTKRIERRSNVWVISSIKHKTFLLSHATTYKFENKEYTLYTSKNKTENNSCLISQTTYDVICDMLKKTTF